MPRVLEPLALGLPTPESVADRSAELPLASEEVEVLLGAYASS